MLRLVSQQPSVPGCAFLFDRSVLSKCKIPTKLPFHFGMGSDERAEKKELPCMKTSWPRELLSHHMPCVLQQFSFPSPWLGEYIWGNNQNRGWKLPSSSLDSRHKPVSGQLAVSTEIIHYKIIYISLVNYRHYPQQTHKMNRKFSLLFLNCICRLHKMGQITCLSGDPPKHEL